MTTPTPTLKSSVTAVRMIPYDGHGYGRSMNWHYYAIRASTKTNEKCKHLDIERVRITMSPVEDGIGRLISFKVSCPECDKKYSKTSEKLTNKFLRFYSLKEKSSS